MKLISLGRHRLKVPSVGLGLTGMTKTKGYHNYGYADEREAISIIHRSLELGGNFLDTADRFGPFENEQVIGKAIKGKRDQYIISTKFGYEIDDSGLLTGQINGKREYVKKAVERSLKNLGTDYIDIYYLHRLDPDTPIEETVGAMVKLVREGKIRYIGLSNVSSSTILRAQKVHPVAAVQLEYSLFKRTAEKTGVLDTLKNLGIAFISHSPLGRGFLSGDTRIKSPGDFPDGDFRSSSIPRFQHKQYDKNQNLVIEIKKIAKEKDITVSQLAIAWNIAKGSLPMPCIRRIKSLEQNIAAASIALSSTDISRLEIIEPPDTSTDVTCDTAKTPSIANQ